MYCPQWHTSQDDIDDSDIGSCKKQRDLPPRMLQVSAAAAPATKRSQVVTEGGPPFGSSSVRWCPDDQDLPIEYRPAKLIKG